MTVEEKEHYKLEIIKLLLKKETSTGKYITDTYIIQKLKVGSRECNILIAELAHEGKIKTRDGTGGRTYIELSSLYFLP